MARGLSGRRRSRITREFERGQREFFTRKHRQEKELLGLEAGFEKELRTALANIAEEGAMRRLLKEQEFAFPVRGAALGKTRQETQQAIDDLRLGRKFAPRLLEARTREAELGTTFLSRRIKELLGQGVEAGAGGPTPSESIRFTSGPLKGVVRPSIMAQRMMEAGLFPGQFIPKKTRRRIRRLRATRGGSGLYRRYR